MEDADIESSKMESETSMGRKAKARRILVIADAAGTGGNYHAGDEAMTLVAMERLKAIVGPENLALLCPHPGTAGPAYGVKAVFMPMRTLKTWISWLFVKPLLSWHQIGRLIWHTYQAEIIFKAGGGNLRGTESRLPILTLANLLHKRIFLVSQTIGPLGEPHRKALQRQLAKADWIGVRDRSYSQAQLGLPVHFAADDAVFLTPKHDAVTAKLVEEHEHMVGISYIGLRPSEMLKGLLATTENIVIDLKAVPVFIPHYTRHRRGDLSVARLLVNEWRRAELIILQQAPPAPAILALTSRLMLVLGSRYHAVVFALTAGVPVVAISVDTYSAAKMRGAFEQFDLDPYLVDIKDVPARLEGAAQKALADRSLFARAAQKVKQTGVAMNMAPYELLARICHPLQGVQ